MTDEQINPKHQNITSLLPAQLPGTHWAMICVIRRFALTVSDVCLKLGCSQSTSAYV